MRVYLITDQKGYTKSVYSVNRGVQQDSQQWGAGITHAPIQTVQFPRFWSSPSLASFLYAAYLDVPTPVLWAGGGEILEYVPPCTVECRSFTALHTIPLRAFTPAQRVYVALRCALAVRVDTPAMELWERWARAWLAGEDRSYASAQAHAYGVLPLPRPMRAAAEAALWATAPVGTEEHSWHKRYAAMTVLWVLRHRVLDIFRLFFSATLAEPEGAPSCVGPIAPPVRPA